MDAHETLNRLRWRCSHRALREMDWLLGGFLDAHYADLTPELAAAFEALVEMEDTDLWPLVSGKRECKDAHQAEVIHRMRQLNVK